MKYCDLHTHSIYSDGTWTPRQLIEEGERIGLGAIALTDHNTVAGLPAFLEAARGRGVEAVPGIEFSTEFRDRELHMIALFVRPEYYGPITDLLADVQRRKDESNRELVQKLSAAGYSLDYDGLKAKTPDGFINRAHIGAALVEKGYFGSLREAFQALLKPERGYYRPPKRMSAYDCIRLIRDMGAVSVLAHPLLTMDEAMTRDFLADAHGLDAMETLYVTYDEQTTQAALEIAEEFHLLSSGGSDFHAANKPDIALGVGRGGLKVPLELLEKLRNRTVR